VDFLLVIIELFSIGVRAEALRAKIDRISAILLQCGQFDPKFQVERDVPHIGVDLAGILGDACPGPKVDWCRVG